MYPSIFFPFLYIYSISPLLSEIRSTCCTFIKYLLPLCCRTNLDWCCIEGWRVAMWHIHILAAAEGLAVCSSHLKEVRMQRIQKKQSLKLESQLCGVKIQMFQLETYKVKVSSSPVDL